MNLNQNQLFSDQISTQILKKWDKNKNNGFGLEQPNLIIKSTKIDQF